MACRDTLPGYAGVTIYRHCLLPGVSGRRKWASNDTPEEPVSHRLRKAGSGVSYGIKRRRNLKLDLTTPLARVQ